MAYKPDASDTVEFDPNALQEMTGEGEGGAVEKEPTPEALETFGTQVKETVAAGLRAGEKTPLEKEQIATLEQTIKVPAAKTVLPPVPQNTEPRSVNTIDFEAPSFDGGPNSIEYGMEAVKELSGGKLEYRRNLGMTNEGKVKISAERAKEIASVVSEKGKEKEGEAFDYVELPDGEDFAERTKNLSMDNQSGFTQALHFKEMANERLREKIITGTAVTGASTFAAGISAATLGYTALGSALTIGVLPIAGAGALAWGGKKLYDMYKVKKAQKNFMAASVARKVSKGLLG